jgi:glucose-6-phosphate isomerase
MTDTLTRGPAWQALGRHHGAVRDLRLRDLFAADARRAERLSFEAAGIHADLSKHRITAETVELLLTLARERRVAEHRDAMLRGEHVNRTENRPALHVALRMPRGRSLVVDGRDVVRDVHEVLDRMGAFAGRVRSGEWRGRTGERIRAVVNIGIGGSDLGPAMAYEALREFSDRELTVRFVSNVDATDLV